MEIVFDAPVPPATALILFRSWKTFRVDVVSLNFNDCFCAGSCIYGNRDWVSLIIKHRTASREPALTYSRCDKLCAVLFYLCEMGISSAPMLTLVVIIHFKRIVENFYGLVKQFSIPNIFPQPC